MKSIQSILMILLTVTLIGLIPNLADAGTKIIIISPDQLVPTTGADNYVRYPYYVSSTDNFTVVFWAKIKFPNNVNRIKELIYYHQSWATSTHLYLYRSKVGKADIEYLGGANSFDNSDDIIKVQNDIPGSPKVDNEWIYWIRVVCGNESAVVRGIKIKVSTR